MSAIFGLYRLDGQFVQPGELEAMGERLAYRGPDGTGLWREGPIGLGQCMLWTTPESLREQLPLVAADGERILTSDARLDNRDELIRALGMNGCSSARIADSELILRAYERWGERCPEHLLGDFAFALWDGRRQMLLCARDHLGVRPFYYYRSERLFVFASEIKGLLSQPEVPRRLNEVRVADFLLPMLEDKAITFYQEIVRLPSGHSMTVGGAASQLRSYWSLNPSRALHLHSDEEYAEAFRQIFTETVRCRLRSAFPIGAMLSGGLDSSSVVAVARHLLAEDERSPLPTFSATFPNLPACDERRYSSLMVAQGGIESHAVPLDGLGPLAAMERIVDHQDEVCYGPNMHLCIALFCAAQEQGVRTLLTGFDGDTTVSHGEAFLRDLARRGRLWPLLRETSGIARNFHEPSWRVLRRGVIEPLALAPLRTTWRRLRGRPEYASDPLINPDFARRINLSERLLTLNPECAWPAPTAREQHWLSLHGGLLPYLLEETERAALAFSVSLRHPFCDVRLVEFCLALPTEQKLHRGWSRMVLRRAMVGLLPDQVRWRPAKTDLSPVARHALLAFDRDRLEEVVHDPDPIAPYIDVPTFRRAYQRYASQGAAAGDATVLMVWKAVSLAAWLRRTGLAA